MDTPSPIAADFSPDASRVELACAEVWGGNRQFATPVELPGIAGYLYAQPCDGGRGGDVHCLSTCGSGLIARICIADVVGHGAAVDAVSREIHKLVRRYLNAFDQRRILKRLNSVLSGGDFGEFATAAVVTYFPPTQTLSVSYAGHPPAWYFSAERGSWSRYVSPEGRSRIGLSDLPLAVDDSTQFTRIKSRVATGDMLLVLTDGVLETPAPEGEEFGADRLQATLDGISEPQPSRVVDAVLTACRAHRAGPLDHDDISLAALEFLPPSTEPLLWRIVRNRLFGRPAGSLGAERPSAAPSPS